MRARRLRQASPDAELKIWNRLRNRQLAGFKFRRQHPVGPYFADFACIEAGLIVELDGSQHFEPEAIEADRRRSAHLMQHGFEVLRFDDRQALLETDGVLETILHRLEDAPPSPQPSPARGRGSPCKGLTYEQADSRRLHRCRDAARRSASRGAATSATRGRTTCSSPRSTRALKQVPALDPKAIEDAIVGCAMPEGEQGMNMARIGALLPGCRSRSAASR